MDADPAGQRLSARSATSKVSSACQRCKRQKLKCDVERPCALCVRTGVDCVAIERSNVWKTQTPHRTAKHALTTELTNNSPKAKRLRRSAPSKERTASASLPTVNSAGSVGDSIDKAKDAPETGISDLKTVGVSWSADSAALTFAEEAFQRHGRTVLESQETSAFSANEWIQSKEIGHSPQDKVTPASSQTHHIPGPIRQAEAQREAFRLDYSRSTEADLLALLPALRPATLIINNYFNRIHWFMLVFHQTEFRESFRSLYEAPEQQSLGETVSLTFLGVFATVCLVSLQHMSTDQKEQLRGWGIQPNDLQQKLLATLKFGLLDIVSLGSIEAVQACILLGSFYLYNGQPKLAWPICGCGLRIAQALGLHRRTLLTDPSVPDLDDPIQRTTETRKRCWWAVYEIETFCSMLYGFPLSISDHDCDVEPLDPYAIRSKDRSWDPAARKTDGRPTLLSYKHSMSQLSRIVKSALTELYGLRLSVQRKDASSKKTKQELQEKINIVSTLDTKLAQWYQALPQELQLAKKPTHSQQTVLASDLDNEYSTSNQAEENHIFGLQALSLALAYENARILVHRPLLSYKMILSRDTGDNGLGNHVSQVQDPCRSSVEACLDAALRISQVGSLPIFKEAADTYAVSFVSVHLFTAVVTLSILTSLEPLSHESYESKMGIRRLMEMQSWLRSRSIVADQGLGISKQLMAAVLAKEKEKLFEFTEDALEGPVLYADNSNDTSGLTTAGNTQDNYQGIVRSQRVPPRDRSHTTPPFTPSQSENTHSQSLVDVDTTTSDPLDAEYVGNYDFCEDPIITQALMDFDQVAYQWLDEPLGQNSQAFDVSLPGSSSTIQDPAWIWGPSYRF